MAVKTYRTHIILLLVVSLLLIVLASCGGAPTKDNAAAFAKPMSKLELVRTLAGRDKNKVITFAGKNLAGLELRNFNFQAAIFTQAYLARTDFRNARLQQVRFDKADLTGAIMVEVDLRQADFRGANLTGVQILPVPTCKG